MHRRYRELCTLLATGQIDAHERACLQRHLESCEKCREFLDEITQLEGGMALPAADRVEHVLVEPPLGIRERFLQRAVADGFHLRPGPILAEPLNRFEPDRLERTVDVESHSRKRWLLIPPLAPFHAAMAVVACVAFGIFGYFIALQRSSPKPTTQTTSVATPKASAAVDANYQQSEKQKIELQGKLQILSAQLTAATADKEELAHKLAEAAQQITKGSAYEQRFKQQTKDLQDAEDRVTKLSADLDTAHRQLAEKDAILVAQQQVATDASAKLSDTELQLQKVSELQSARSEIGQLISARNLHIVDVRDSEPGGKRQAAFGRVFYVEGQSLVFYAYDLGASGHPNRQITFHVWGETASVKETTYSLGILHSDDSTQARWVLTFDDPKVLNRINAVYITADHDIVAKKNPQGRKLLYAFLGAPNHP